MASATCGAHVAQQRGVGGEQLDLDRLGRVRQVADHVLQHLDELHVDARLLLLDLGAQIGDDFVDAAIALALELDRDVAGIGLGHGRQPQLQAGAARVAFHFGKLAHHLLDVADHTVGLLQRGAGRHDVVDHEAAFIHVGQQVGAQAP